jgi:transcription-repair coupling factor (superfamily II helicase)
MVQADGWGELLAPTIEALLARVQGSDGPLRATGLFGASKALVIAEVARRAGRPTVVLVPTGGDAETLARDLQFFARGATGLLPERDEDPEVRAQRVACLAGLARKALPLVVVPVQAALERLSPPSALFGPAITLAVRRLIPRDEVRRALEMGGYRRVGQVTDRGEYSVRGNLIDVFPPGQASPVRLELFGDELATLREFDPVSQRSVRLLDEITLLPVTEIPLTDAACDEALRTLRTAARARGVQLPPDILKALEDRRRFPGMEAYLPYFYGAPADLCDYAPSDALWILVDPAGLEARAREAIDADRRARERDEAEGGLLPAVEATSLDWAGLEGRLRSRSQVLLEEFLAPGSGALGASISFQVRTIPAYRGRLRDLAHDLRGWQSEGRRVHLVCRSEAQARRLQEALKEHELFVPLLGEEEAAPPGGIVAASGELSSGFHLDECGLTYVTDAEIFGPRHLPRQRSRPRAAPPFASAQELTYGDYVVHVDHGIGKYKGLRQLHAGGMEGDYLLIVYADNAKLYVPTSKLHLVHRYLGADGEPPAVDRLGGTSWARAKERVKASIREMARELLTLYAARQVIKGYAFPPDSPWQQEFEAAFPYEETPGQLQAIADVKADMERDRPMDRLVCGDVGYGKTEVAMRAAFKAVMGGKQVAVLVPTTVLALQHLQTFAERFASFPIRVEMLSRFRTRKDQGQVLRGLRDGTVDIVIGTHRLLQRDVRFRDLGLLVVDEEHRFGVAAKERLKQLKRQVDVLTLSATPIPRTLHMALMGVRDISTIETPPADRLSIKTTVARYDPALIQEAIEQELDRGGQVFVVHNRVQTIQRMARLIKQLVPRARLAVAHGELPEERLERIMCDFYAGRYDVLLCTTIIESGLDVGGANTIIVDRADTLGLAQLYQLRGRVGRDKRRAYAYLLVPEDAALTDLARKRLQVIAELTELGSGFKVAARDLEIRGAGNLLGPEQHGQIAAVGFDLYCRLMEATIRELKGEPVPEPAELTIRLEAEGYLPESYVEDPDIRLQLYRRLTAVSTLEEIVAFREELVDRFGDLPPQAERLLEAVRLRTLAAQLAVRELDARGGAIRLVFGADPPFDASRVARLLQAEAGRLRYIPRHTFEYRVNGDATFATAERLLTRLLECVERR